MTKEPYFYFVLLAYIEREPERKENLELFKALFKSQPEIINLTYKIQNPDIAIFSITAKSPILPREMYLFTKTVMNDPQATYLYSTSNCPDRIQERIGLFRPNPPKPSYVLVGVFVSAEKKSPLDFFRASGFEKNVIKLQNLLDRYRDQAFISSGVSQRKRTAGFHFESNKPISTTLLQEITELLDSDNLMAINFEG